MSAVAVENNLSSNSDADLLALLGDIDESQPLTIVEAPRTTMLDDLRALDEADKAQSALTELFDAAPTDAPVEAAKPAEAAPAPAKTAAKKGGKKKEEKPKTEAAPVEPAPAIEAAKPEVAAPEEAPEQKRTPQRMTFATKSEKISHRLGEKDVSYLILDTKDQGLSAEEQAEEQARVLAMVDKMPIKVGEKAAMLFNFLQNRGQLNEVMRRAFTVLLQDGYLSGGGKGNLISNLLTKPYSPGTASSQTTQMFALFPALKICFPRENGQIAMNPDSTILALFRENPHLLVNSRKGQ